MLPLMLTLSTLQIAVIISILFTVLVIALAIGDALGKRGESESVVSRVERLQQVPKELLDELRPDLLQETKNKSILANVNLQPVLSRFMGEAYFAKLELDLEQADIPLKVSEFLITRGILITLFFMITLYVSKNIFIALVVGFLLLFIHIPIFSFRKKGRVTKFSNQLAEFLILIVNSLRAGQTFMQGADIAAKESADPISSEFKRMLKEVNLGMPVEQSMDNLLARVPSEDLKIVVSAYTIQRQVGGNLATIFETTASTIRERIRIQGQISTLTTQGKLSGVLVGALPFVLGAILTAMKPEMMHDFMNDTYGKGIIIFALILQAMGAFAIMKIVDIEV